MGAATVVVPLTYVVWLPAALHRYAGAGGLLLDGDGAPVGVNLNDALWLCLGLVPASGLSLGVIGAAIGARIRRRPAGPSMVDGGNSESCRTVIGVPSFMDT